MRRLKLATYLVTIIGFLSFLLSVIARNSINSIYS